MKKDLVGRPSELHCLEKLIYQFDLFVTGFEGFVFLQRHARAGDVRQAVINQGEIVIDEREVRFDLRRRFVMQTRERKIAGVVVKIREIVMRFDVSRVMLQ